MISLSSFPYANLFSLLLLFFLLCAFLLWTLFFSHYSLVLHHCYRPSYTYFSPTLSLNLLYFFNAQWHSRVFIAGGECPGRCNFNSIASCIRGMIYVCMYMHTARQHEEDDVALRLYLGFVGDAFVTLTGSFLFPLLSFFLSTPLWRIRRIGQDDLLTEIEKRIQFRRISIYILSDSYSSQNRSHICLYIFLFSSWNI